MRTSVTEFDKAIINSQPDFDERKTRADFRKVIPNLKTVVFHCFDPRVTSGIPYAVVKALPAQQYPGEIFEFVDEHGERPVAPRGSHALLVGRKTRVLAPFRVPQSLRSASKSPRQPPPPSDSRSLSACAGRARSSDGASLGGSAPRGRRAIAPRSTN
jgi:hypothetical protein